MWLGVGSSAREAAYPAGPGGAEPRGTSPAVVQSRREAVAGVRRERRQLFPGVGGEAEDCTVGWVGGSRGC